MEIQQTTKRVKALILEGLLEDATDEMIAFLGKNVLTNKDKAILFLYNQVIHQASQLNEVKNAQLSGIISEESATLKRNQIRKALIELNNNLLDIDRGTADFLPFHDTEKSKPRQRNILLILVLIGGIALGGGLIYFFLPNQESPPTVATTPVTTSDTEASTTPTPREPIRPEKTENVSPTASSTTTNTEAGCRENEFTLTLRDRTVLRTSNGNEKITWRILHNGKTVLERNAGGETHYDYFGKSPGKYDIYLIRFCGGYYQRVSNMVSYVIE